MVNHQPTAINWQNDSSSISSIIILSASILSFMAIFMGIKLRWFRHRLTFEQPDNSVVLLRSTHEIRENCSIGVYRQSNDVENVINTNNTYSSTISSSANVNGKNLNRESIFRWPFRSKLNLSRNQSVEENVHSNDHIKAIPSDLNLSKREQDEITAYKNEKLIRLIYERLNAESISVPDLSSTDESKTIEKKQDFLSISTDSEAPKIPKIKERKRLKVKTQKSETLNHSELSEVPPPTPMRRKSHEKKNHIDKQEILEIPQKPPLVKPRTKKLNPITVEHLESETEDVLNAITNYDELFAKVKPRKLSLTAETNETQYDVKIKDVQMEIVHAETNLSNELELQVEPTYLKSILKTSEATGSPKRIKFRNLPIESNSESESSYYGDDDDDDDEDVWSRINQHRYQLNRQVDKSKLHSPPPLPKSEDTSIA